MRRLILSMFALVSLIHVALADGAPAFSQPMSESSLRQLDNEQLRIVRRAIQTCPTVAAGRNIIRPERNPCVTASTEKAIADTQDADLQAFHKALRQSERYDENRTAASWMAWLKKD